MQMDFRSTRDEDGLPNKNLRPRFSGLGDIPTGFLTSGGRQNRWCTNKSPGLTVGTDFMQC